MAGNNGVQATGDAASFGKVSGIAPRARLSVYKACWVTAASPSGACNSADTTAAIDQAVADGVDAINYSISGTTTAFTNSVEVSFLFAAAAGVYVSASAGNSGPAANTVAHPSPWITTTAAGTHNRDGKGTVTIDGTTYNGGSSAATAATGQMVVYGAPILGALPTEAGATPDQKMRLCFDGFVPPSPGKIVVCERGVNARIDKSLAVLHAGGAGMIMVNATPNSVNADLHFVPSIHLADTLFDTVELGGAGAQDRLALEGHDRLRRGCAVHGVVLVARPDHGRRRRHPEAGHHRAGSGHPRRGRPAREPRPGLRPLQRHVDVEPAHRRQSARSCTRRHPDWSPMMIKSALMTTAYQGHDYDPFNWGAGHVDPNKATDPGLVFDSNLTDWLSFLKGQNLYTGPEPAIDASDLNSASIAIGDMAGAQTVKRTATSVGSKSEKYTFSTTGLTGIQATPSVTSFTAAPGSSTPWTVTFLNTGAPGYLNTYSKGFIVWSGDKGHTVRMPVAIRPVKFQAPAEVSVSSGANGS